ncbi:MAG: aminoacyl-tRNA hydrolase [Francisellaceae bacterium]|nr:aminoacyl-tRNA hydrolase [Francisellaceae bacterium]
MGKISLIVGLGNPGNKYTTTRHNVGWWYLNELTQARGITLKANTKFNGLYAKSEQGIHFIQPMTYMNLSGESVSSIANFYKIAVDEILVLHDELDLPAGTIKLKIGGGHGGHNGLRSLIAKLGSRDFNRLRIGIGHPGHRDLVESYVLTTPNKSDLKLINESIADSMYSLDDIIYGNNQKAMQDLHSKN